MATPLSSEKSFIMVDNPEKRASSSFMYDLSGVLTFRASRDTLQQRLITSLDQWFRHTPMTGLMSARAEEFIFKVAILSTDMAESATSVVSIYQVVVKRGLYLFFFSEDDTDAERFL